MNKFLSIAAVLYGIHAVFSSCTPEIQEFIDPVPIATSGEDIKTTAFTATWRPLLGAESYLLEVATDGSFENEFSITELPIEVADTTYTLEGLKVSHTYYYRVVARLSTGEQTRYSNTIAVSTSDMPSPNAMVATEINTNQFTARWQRVAEARSYEVEIGTDIDFTEIASLQRIVTEDTFIIIKSDLNVDQDYFYRVKARDGDIISDFSNVVHLTTTRLTQPILLDVTNDVQNEFIFHWIAVAGAANYTVEVTTDPLFLSEAAYLVQDDLTQDTLYEVSDLNPNTSYYFRVRAHSNNSSSEHSQKGVVTTLPLPTPTTSEATNLSGTSFTAVWTSVNEIDTYALEVSTFPDFTTLLLSADNITDTTHTIVELTGDQTYYYRVRAEKDNHYSAYSNVTTQYLIALEQPSNLLITSTAYTSFDITWDVVPDASYYVIDIATDEQFTNILSDFEEKSVTSPSINIEGLLTNTRYYFRIKAYNSYTSSAYSETSSTKTDSITPPVAQQPPNVGEYEIYAKWTLVPGATSYSLDVATDANFSTFVPGNENLSVAGTSSIVRGLQPSTTYYYRVRATIDNNTSNYSNIISVDTDDAPALEIPGTVEAENYTQHLGTIRVASPTTSGGYYLGDLTKDDSVVYRVDIPSTNSYTLTIRVANKSGNTTFVNVRQENDNNPSLIVASEGSDWGDWRELTTVLNLEAGSQNIWLKFSGGNNELMRIDWIKLE